MHRPFHTKLKVLVVGPSLIKTFKANSSAYKDLITIYFSGDLSAIYRHILTGCMLRSQCRVITHSFIFFIHLDNHSRTVL